MQCLWQRAPHLCDAVPMRAIGFGVLDKVGVVQVQAIVAKVHALLFPLDHPVAVVIEQEHHQVQLQAEQNVCYHVRD